MGPGVARGMAAGLQGGRVPPGQQGWEMGSQPNSWKQARRILICRRRGGAGRQAAWRESILGHRRTDARKPGRGLYASRTRGLGGALETERGGLRSEVGPRAGLPVFAQHRLTTV